MVAIFIHKDAALEYSKAIIVSGFLLSEDNEMANLQSFKVYKCCRTNSLRNNHLNVLEQNSCLFSGLKNNWITRSLQIISFAWHTNFDLKVSWTMSKFICWRENKQLKFCFSEINVGILSKDIALQNISLVFDHHPSINPYILWKCRFNIGISGRFTMF